MDDVNFFIISSYVPPLQATLNAHGNGVIQRRKRLESRPLVSLPSKLQNQPPATEDATELEKDMQANIADDSVFFIGKMLSPCSRRGCLENSPLLKSDIPKQKPPPKWRSLSHLLMI